MNGNPFNFGHPVKNGDFYNRKEEMSKAIELIRNLQSFSIVGERRIGKTSFLEYILSEELLRRYGIFPENYIIVKLDMSSLVETTRDALIGEMIEKIGVSTQIDTQSKSLLENFKGCADRAFEDGKNLVIAFDEFEKIESIPDSTFFDWLRSIFQKSNVMAITASRTTIRGIGSDKMSPLYNIFTNLFLGLFEREETEKMISEMFSKGDECLDDKEISFLADLAGRNPYLVQFIGFHYYEERRKNRTIDENEFEDDMLYNLKDIFEGYWEHLSKKERESLFRAAGSRRFPASILAFLNILKSDIASKELERRGFLAKEKGRRKIFSTLFEKFMTEKNEFKKFKERQKRKLVSWIFGIIGLVGFIIGIKLITSAADKLQELDIDMGSMTEFALDPNFVVGLCSLIFSVLSFIISLTSKRKSK